jgi:Uma2 family endonuclease
MASMAAERVVPYGKKNTIKYANRKPMTYAQFQKKYLNKDDRFKYEWVKGFTIISPHTMERYQFFILRNLRNFFNTLEKNELISGSFEGEFNLFFGEEINRKPDMFYFTEEQADAISLGENPIPDFVIEVISNTDQLNYMIDKMDDYRNAGVKVVWHIFTIKNEVHVYAGENLMSMTVCKGASICSAAPVLPQFALSVNDIFKMPQLKTTPQSAP